MSGFEGFGTIAALNGAHECNATLCIQCSKWAGQTAAAGGMCPSLSLATMDGADKSSDTCHSEPCSAGQASERALHLVDTQNFRFTQNIDEQMHYLSFDGKASKVDGLHLLN